MECSRISRFVETRLWRTARRASSGICASDAQVPRQDPPNLSPPLQPGSLWGDLKYTLLATPVNLTSPLRALSFFPIPDTLAGQEFFPIPGAPALQTITVRSFDIPVDLLVYWERNSELHGLHCPAMLCEPDVAPLPRVLDPVLDL